MSSPLVTFLLLVSVLVAQGQGLTVVDDLHVEKENQSCRTIDGPGAGKPCIFPFIYMGKVYNTCKLDKRYWCATAVDENGRLVLGNKAACSLGCPGVTHVGYKERKCATEEAGVQCTIPFSYMGFQYHGCIKTTRTKGDKHWCVVKDKMAEKGFRRVNCAKSCPKDTALSEEILSPEVIVEKLKTNTEVYSKIERGRDCMDYMSSYNMTKVCLEADYCSPDKRKSKKVLDDYCGSFTTLQRKNDIVGGVFPALSDCVNRCGKVHYSNDSTTQRNKRSRTTSSHHDKVELT